MGRSRLLVRLEGRRHSSRRIPHAYARRAKVMRGRSLRLKGLAGGIWVMLRSGEERRVARRRRRLGLRRGSSSWTIAVADGRRRGSLAVDGWRGRRRVLDAILRLSRRRLVGLGAAALKELLEVDWLTRSRRRRRSRCTWTTETDYLLGSFDGAKKGRLITLQMLTRLWLNSRRRREGGTRVVDRAEVDATSTTRDGRLCHADCIGSSTSVGTSSGSGTVAIETGCSSRRS